jgi:NYN domain
MDQQATLLQIDAQNLFYEANFRGQKIDFEKIAEHFNSREAEVLTDSIAYIIQSEETKKTESRLRNLGFKLKLKTPPKTIKALRYAQNWLCPKCTSTFKGLETRLSSAFWNASNMMCPECAGTARNFELSIFHNQREIEVAVGSPHFHDIEITLDCMDRIDTFNKWIIISGNGDFLDLCKYLRHRGKKIEIWNFKECTNSMIETYADRINPIDDTFSYKRPVVSIFGFTHGPENLQKGSSDSI